MDSLEKKKDHGLVIKKEWENIKWVENKGYWCDWFDIAMGRVLANCTRNIWLFGLH